MIRHTRFSGVTGVQTCALPISAAAEAAADQVLLTSDNPRSESPEAIVAAMVQGLRRSQSVQIQLDRALAIDEALAQAAARHGCPWLLLGHHRGDQAETLAFRALRGSGAAGLAAMAPLRAVPECLLLRPLLGFAPARLEAVVAAAGLAPVRDPSNDNPRFARIRIRQALGDPDGEGEGILALAEAAGAFARRRARKEAALLPRLAAAAN